jgi:hypothetical protein
MYFATGIPVAEFLPPNNDGDGSARDASGTATGTEESL